MKVTRFFGALVTAFATLSANAGVDVPVSYESAAETKAVAPAVNPAPVKQTPKASSTPRSMPISTTGYQVGAETMALPGLGVLPGNAKSELQDNVIRVTSNKTEVIDISATLTNRIATPFPAPKAILLDGGATVQAEGQSLYIALDGSPNPVALYVTGSEPNDPVVSLTLMPHSLPPQTIVLQLDGLDKTIGGSSTDVQGASPNSPIYTERLVGIMRSVALGQTPEGFVKGLLPTAAADFGSFVAVPLARFSSSDYDVYRYRLVTNSVNTIELDEASFATKGVRAVAFFPSALIAKNVPTEVLVIADKKATVVGSR